MVGCRWLQVPQTSNEAPWFSGAEPVPCKDRRSGMRRYLFLAVALLLTGCAGAAAPTGSEAPGGSPGIQPSPVVIATPEAAAARVIALQTGLAGIEAHDPDVIGGCCFWQATETADGFEVTFEVGWGDCPAGCIERHRWVYAVGRDGSVELVDEQGDPVPAGLPSASSDPASGGGILPGGSGIRGTVTAGPTCPVVSANDPSCDDRPIAGATVLVLDAAGREVARVVTDADGRYAVALPAGPYVVEPQPVEGFLRMAEPVPVTVGDGFVAIDLAYDTGIR